MSYRRRALGQTPTTTAATSTTTPRLPTPTATQPPWTSNPHILPSTYAWLDPVNDNFQLWLAPPSYDLGALFIWPMRAAAVGVGLGAYWLARRRGASKRKAAAAGVATVLLSPVIAGAASRGYWRIMHG